VSKPVKSDDAEPKSRHPLVGVLVLVAVAAVVVVACMFGEFPGFGSGSGSGSGPRRVTPRDGEKRTRSDAIVVWFGNVLGLCLFAGVVGFLGYLVWFECYK
jgi:hypothetical protein